MFISLKKYNFYTLSILENEQKKYENVYKAPREDTPCDTLAQSDDTFRISTQFFNTSYSVEIIEWRSLPVYTLYNAPELMNFVSAI